MARSRLLDFCFGFVVALVLFLLYDINRGQPDSQRRVEHVFDISPSKSLSEPIPESDTPWFFENESVEQNNPDILKYLLENHITPPSTEPYHLDKPKGFPSQYHKEVKKLFGDKKGGFFIECGANDGEYLSNTLALERDQNWTGLLVEANQVIVPDLKKRNRKAWIADVCLSLKPYPQRMKFLHRAGDEKVWYKGMGILEQGNASWIDGRDPKNYMNNGLVDCFPLFSILSAINVTTVDYFSLDIEGVELKVLQTIPFDKIDIRALSVESNLIPEGVPALLKFMKSNGYKQAFKSWIEIFFVKET